MIMIYMRKEAKQPKNLDVFSKNMKGDLIQNCNVTQWNIYINTVNANIALKILHCRTFQITLKITKSVYVFLCED